jgi:hypothetical protein
MRLSVKFRMCGAGWPWGVGLLTNVGVRVGDWVAGRVGDRARQWASDVTRCVKLVRALPLKSDLAGST